MANEKRLIDANAFGTYLEEVRQEMLEEDTMSGNFAAEVIETVQDEYLQNAPTVDAVEVVHGKWIKTEVGSNCSACGLNVMSWSGNYDGYEREKGICLMNYCPNCGAKMDAKE